MPGYSNEDLMPPTSIPEISTSEENPVLKILRDPAWQSAGVVVTIVVALVIYLLQRQRKSLSYEILSINQLLTVGEELEGKLQVIYNGEPAKDICLLIIRLYNSGNLPITTADYERPVSLLTGDSSKILSTVITNVNPENLSFQLKIESQKISIDPILLNSKDSVTIKMLISDFSGKLVVDGRIAGVKSISNSQIISMYDIVISLITLVSITYGIYVLIKDYGMNSKPSTNFPFIPVGFIIFGYLSAFFSRITRKFVEKIAEKVINDISIRF
jgi:hypothetical protein